MPRNQPSRHTPPGAPDWLTKRWNANRWLIAGTHASQPYPCMCHHYAWHHGKPRDLAARCPCYGATTPPPEPADNCCGRPTWTTKEPAA